MDETRQPGIRFDTVLLRRASYEELPEGEQVEREFEELALSIAIRSRFPKAHGETEPTTAEVQLKLSVEPASAPPPFFAEVVVAGRFSYADEKNLNLDAFVSNQAPALLFPFAREAIANLTVRTRFGPVLIPPVNVRALIEQDEQSVSVASAGRESASPRTGD